MVAVWCAQGWSRRGRKDHTTSSYLVYVVQAYAAPLLSDLPLSLGGVVEL